MAPTRMAPIRAVAARAALPTVLLLLMLGLGACGGETDTTATTETTETTETMSTTTTTEPPPTQTEQPPPTTEAPTVTTMRIALRGGKTGAGIRRVSVKKGEKVRIVVTSDLADEVHLHGYDLTARVGPSKRAIITFAATIPGRFEVELEERGLQIGELEVRP